MKIQFNFPIGVPVQFVNAGGQGFNTTVDANGVTFSGGVVSFQENKILTVTVTPQAAGTLASEISNVVVDLTNVVAETNENNNHADTVSTLSVSAVGQKRVAKIVHCGEHYYL